MNAAKPATGAAAPNFLLVSGGWPPVYTAFALGQGRGFYHEVGQTVLSNRKPPGLLEEESGGFALAHQTISMRKGNIVGAVEPEVHQERIRPRSDPAIRKIATALAEDCDIRYGWSAQWLLRPMPLNLAWADQQRYG